MKRKQPRTKRSYDNHTLIADLQRLPPDRRRQIRLRFKQWLRRAGYLALLLSAAAYLILQA